MIELIRLATTAIKDRKGVTAMEYAVIAAGIVIVVALAADHAGSAVNGIINSIADWIQGKEGQLG